ncbi:MAG: hypothetical protein IH934_03385 [Nanoarchaeota archaeon]|nr:hypothetical protein [Nanoarchaeota archaeon]
MSRKVKLFNKEIEVKVLLEVLAVYAILALVLTGIYYLEPTITGFITVTKQLNHTEVVNLEFAESSEYIWILQNPGDLKSIRIDGSISKHGTAKVYIENNGVRYLIFDSSKLVEKPSGIFGITGFVVEENKTKPNRPPVWNSSIDSFIVNESLVINLNNYFNDKDNDPLTYSASELNTNDLEILLQNEILTVNNKNNIEGNRTLEIIASDNITSKKKEIVFALIKFEELNNAPLWNSEVDSFSLNGTIAVNLSLYFYDKDDDILIYSTSNVTNVSVSISNEIITLIPDNNVDETKQITFAAYDGSEITFKIVSLVIRTTEDISIKDTINETVVNETIEKIINVNLEYGDNEFYDANNDGVESLTGIIDFTTKNTDFNWNAKQEKLCTRYEVFSIEKQESTFACFGDSNCCAFVNLQNSREFWNESLFLTFGSYGSTNNNIISAQVLNVDYNLSADNPYSDIVYSSWANLTAKFVKDIIEFEDVCIDACLISNFNASSYKLIIEIENTTLKINEIKYTVEIELPEPSENITISEPKENITCKEFQDYVIWSSGYSLLPKGSTNYQTWKIGTNCTEAGGNNCSLQNINVSTRVIHTDRDDLNASAEGYIQISDPDESICDAPEQAKYSRYLAYDSLTGEDIRKGWKCGKNKNKNAKCGVEITNNYNDNVTCYGIKAYGAQYVITDVFEVKYTWCWTNNTNSITNSGGENAIS